MEQSDSVCTVPNGALPSSLAALAPVIDRPFELFHAMGMADKLFSLLPPAFATFGVGFSVWKCLGRSFISAGVPTEGDYTVRGRTELLCIN